MSPQAAPADRSEPLNLKLRRLTPRWALFRWARRRLVLALYLAPLSWLSAAALWPASLTLLALPALGTALLALLWLMGATSSRADLPDSYLDEREQQFRSEVYRLSFLWLIGLISLGYNALTLLDLLSLPLPRVTLQGLFGLLFALGLPLPTVMQAWLEPDPIGEEHV